MESQGTLRIWWKVSSLVGKVLTAALILAGLGAAVGYYFWTREEPGPLWLVGPLVFLFGGLFLGYLSINNDVVRTREEEQREREEQQREKERQERQGRKEERLKSEILLIREALGGKEVEIKSDVGEVPATRFEFTDDKGVEQEGLIDNYGDVYRLWIRE